MSMHQNPRIAHYVSSFKTAAVKHDANNHCIVSLYLTYENESPGAVLHLTVNNICR